MFSLVALAGLISAASGSLVTTPGPAAGSTLTLNGVDYTWKGAVGFGYLDANDKDAWGDTLGGLGSAINVKKWRSNGDGTYSGTIVAQPDRGYNVQELMNYAARTQYIDFTLTPCTAASCNAAGSPSLALTYTGGLKYLDDSPLNENGGYSTGLDPINVRPASGDFTELPAAENNALSIDAEGLALMEDGTFWTSDEYGPAIYHIAADGTLLSSILPPDAFLPHNSDGNLDFATEDGSTIVSGRATNQGFEGLTISPDNTKLYVLLQSALVQDQIVANENVQYTRMIEYDITTPTEPVITGQWVVELPYTADKVFAQSEIAWVSEGIFMVLARDGKGNGNGDSPASSASKKQVTSVFKNIGLISLADATNINGLYDSVGASVAPEGVLDSSIVAADFNQFINIIDATELAKFGLQNGKPLDTDITGKFESIAIQPVLDPAFPNDYFVFTMADNDFIATEEVYDGVSLGSDPYMQKVQSQVFVHRVTLPGASTASYLLDQSLNPSGLARRRMRRAICPTPLKECSLGFGKSECVDTETALEQCGGCANDGGIDCTAIQGVVGVECVAGTCVATSCDADSELANGICI